MREWLACTAAAGVILLASMGAARAEVALKDDAVYGVQSVILDVDNHKEFLSLEATVPYTYAEVVNEFGPGGRFAGWQVASQHDLGLLALSANLTMGSTDPAMVARVEQLRDWFGAVRVSTTHNYARGLVSDFAYPVTYNGAKAQLAYSFGVKYDVSPQMVDCRISGYGSLDDRSESIFLIRDENSGVVPTPPDSTDGCDASLDATNPNCEQICLPTAGREKGKNACVDGIDNDCDGFVDAADSDCARKGHGNK